MVITGESASRDFIYVADLAQGLLKILDKGTSGEAYNLATGSEVKILDAAKLIVNLCASKSKVIVQPSRSWDNSGRRFASTYKSETELGFVSRFDIKEGLERTISWAIQNKAEIEDSIKKHSTRN